MEVFDFTSYLKFKWKQNTTSCAQISKWKITPRVGRGVLKGTFTLWLVLGTFFLKRNLAMFIKNCNIDMLCSNNRNNENEIFCSHFN